MPNTPTSDWLRRAMRSFDAITAILVSGSLAWTLPELDHTDGIEYPLLIVAGGMLLPACGEFVGLYRPWRGRSIFAMLGSYLLGWVMAILMISVFLVLTHSADTFSRRWMAFSSLGVLAAGILLRTALYTYLRRLRARGRNLKRVWLIAPPTNLARLEERLASMRFTGYQVTGKLPVEDGESLQGQVDRFVRDSVFQRDFDEIWLSFPLSQGELVKRLTDQLISIPVDLRYFPDLSDVRLLNHRVAQVADMYSLDLNYSPLNGPMRIVKVLEDRLLGALLFVLFLPVMLIIAGLVYWKMGSPVLFKQERHGLDGKRFRIYKFRTMGQEQEQGGRTRQACPGDRRITPLGALLRRTSLDELPQLYNVLQGRMSLVGPRPHAMDHNDHYKDLIDTYMQRHRVKPGMTGWAQVNGLRGITEDIELMRKRVEYDLYYIDKWSLGLDLKILVLTLTRGFVNRQP